jgi:hypothetical protein
MRGGNVIGNVLVLSGLVAGIFGCVGQQKALDITTANALRGKTLAITRRDDAHFNGASTTKNEGGQLFSKAGTLVDSSTAASGGRSLAKQYQLHDPTSGMSKQVARTMQKQYQLRLANGSIRVNQNNVIEISNKASGSDFVLDIETLNWNIDSYTSRIKLIDVQSSKVLAQGSCMFNADEHSVATAGLNKAALLANNGALLQQRYQEARQYCINHFVKLLLSPRTRTQ